MSPLHLYNLSLFFSIYLYLRFLPTRFSILSISGLSGRHVDLVGDSNLCRCPYIYLQLASLLVSIAGCCLCISTITRQLFTLFFFLLILLVFLLLSRVAVPQCSNLVVVNVIFLSLEAHSSLVAVRSCNALVLLPSSSSYCFSLCGRSQLSCYYLWLTCFCTLLDRSSRCFCLQECFWFFYYYPQSICFSAVI